MAEPAAVGQIYRVQYRSRLQNQRVINTIDYRLMFMPNPIVVTAVYDELITFLGGAQGLTSAYLAVAPSNMLLENIGVQCIFPVRIMQEFSSVQLFGTAGVAETANIQQSIEKRGEKATRYAVGGMRIPISTDPSKIVGGNVSNAQLALLNTLAERFTNQLGDGTTTLTLAPIIYNRSFIPNYTIMVRALPKNTVRVMRRRTVGLGE